MVLRVEQYGINAYSFDVYGFYTTNNVVGTVMLWTFSIIMKRYF